jgi:hypothetical protein
MIWEIMCYVSNSGRCDVQSTYDKGTEELKAEFDTAIEYLRQRGRDRWTRPHAHKLSKSSEFRDFFEIRFKANRTQQRPIGFFGPADNQFTIVIWATEKGRLIPEEWFQTANTRRKDILSGDAKTVIFKSEGDE